MNILKYIVPAAILKKYYKNKYTSSSKELTPEEEDAISDLKDDRE